MLDHEVSESWLSMKMTRWGQVADELDATWLKPEVVTIVLGGTEANEAADKALHLRPAHGLCGG